MTEESAPPSQAEKKKRSRTSLSKVVGGVKKKTKLGIEELNEIDSFEASGERYAWIGNPVRHYTSVMIRTADGTCEQISVGNFINVQKVGKTGIENSTIAFVNDMTERIDTKNKLLKRIEIKKVYRVSAIPAPTEAMQRLHPDNLVISEQVEWINIDRVLGRRHVVCLTPSDEHPEPIDTNSIDENASLVCRYFYDMGSNVFIPLTPQNVEFMMGHGPLNDAKEIFARYQSRGCTLPAYRDKRKVEVDAETAERNKLERRDADKLRLWGHDVSSCPAEVRAFLNANIPGWNKAKVYTMHTRMQAVIGIAERYHARGDVLPVHYAHADEREGHAQQRKDSSMLYELRRARQGKGQHVLTDDVKEYLDREIPGWSDGKIKASKAAAKAVGTSPSSTSSTSSSAAAAAFAPATDTAAASRRRK